MFGSLVIFWNYPAAARAKTAKRALRGSTADRGRYRSPFHSPTKHQQKREHAQAVGSGCGRCSFCVAVLAKTTTDRVAGVAQSGRPPLTPQQPFTAGTCGYPSRMTRFGYTLMTEQSGPKELVRYSVSAERAGFEFEVSSDHFSPWLAAQGHAPNAWAMLGAVAHATDTVELFTYVTCPTMRYHPAVVAQQAATLQILADGRFTLGLGSGENLNEHVVGKGWPTVRRRQDMLCEAIQIIRELLTGDLVDWKGEYFQVDSARLWDIPDVPVAIAAAVSGDRSVEAFAPLADHMIAVEPDKDLVDSWHDARRATGLPGDVRVVGQIPICWDPDRDTAVKRAHEQFRWFARRLGCERRPSDDRRIRRCHSVRASRRMSPSRSRAGLISTRSSTRPAPTGRPASPISPSSRSATRARTSSSRKRPHRCSRHCGPQQPEADEIPHGRQ